MVPIVRPRSAAGPGAPASGGARSGAADGRRIAVGARESDRLLRRRDAAESARPGHRSRDRARSRRRRGRSWLADEGARVDRYGRPATVVLVEVAGLDRLAERLGPEAADRLIPPIATTMRRHARAADTSPGSGRRGSGRSCPRPTRSGRSTTSSGSGRPATSGSSRARSRSGCRSAGRRSAPISPSRSRPDGRAPAQRGAPAAHASGRTGTARTPRPNPGPRSPTRVERPPCPRRFRSVLSRGRGGGPGRRRAGVRPVVDDELAVDDHVVDPVRVAARLVVRRVAADGRRVEDHEVGDGAVAERAAVAAARAGPPAPTVIRRIASSRPRSASSRTNWPRIRGKLP